MKLDEHALETITGAKAKSSLTLHRMVQINMRSSDLHSYALAHIAPFKEASKNHAKGHSSVVKV